MKIHQIFWDIIRYAGNTVHYLLTSLRYLLYIFWVKFFIKKKIQKYIFREMAKILLKFQFSFYLFLILNIESIPPGLFSTLKCHFKYKLNLKCLPRPLLPLLITVKLKLLNIWHYLTSSIYIKFPTIFNRSFFH